MHNLILAIHLSSASEGAQPNGIRVPFRCT
jgi:hypothetical protein